MSGISGDKGGLLSEKGGSGLEKHSIPAPKVRIYIDR